MKFSNKQNSIIVVIVSILCGVLIVLSSFNYKEKVIKDNIKFSKEYNLVSEDNVFVYKNIDEIIKIMENGTGVVYLGFPECPWCQAYVKYLNEVALDVGIDKIYYFNIKEDRENNSDNYKKIVSILDSSLLYDSEGNKRIYVPNVSFHINGKLIGNDLETAFDTKGLSDPSEYWTEEEINELKDNLYLMMSKVYGSLSTCTECNK